MVLSINDALIQGIDAHRTGKYDEAEKFYRFILSSNPSNPDANHNLGSISVIYNKIDEAIHCFKKALKGNPKIEQFWLSYIGLLINENRFQTAKIALNKARNLGLSKNIIINFNKKIISKTQNPTPPESEIKNIINYFKTKDFKEAENRALLLTKDYPNHPFGWKTLSIIFRETSRYKEAYIALKKNIDLTPNDPEAHNNLGLTLQKLKQFKDAQICFFKSIKIKPDFDEAYNNLGCTFEALNDFSEAEKCFSKAIELNPNLSEPYINLGQIHNYNSQINNALDCFIKAIIINPTNTNAFHNLSIILRQGVNFTKTSEELNSCISKLLEINYLFRPIQISKSLINLTKLNPYFKTISFKEFPIKSVNKLEEIINHLSKDKILLKLMTICPIQDLELEDIIREIRACLILNISKVKITSEIKEFLTALALQCFTNEYIYEATKKEISEFTTLNKKIEKDLQNGFEPKFLDLAILASYKPLFEFDWKNLISVNTDNETLVNRQLLGPKKETELASGINNLINISDKTSIKVRKQYEENPYPRWINTGLCLTSFSIPEFVEKANLKVDDIFASKIQRPRILVAGCGTGQHSIMSSTRFRNSTVLAIDLSVKSLGYAKMKTEELNINNIEYINADILDLDQYDEKFDIIESSGVLHHMEDPYSGWEILTNCLNKGGLMAIGLYSELARKHIVEARKEIKSLKLSDDLEGIKSIRKIIKNSENINHKKIKSMQDFYSTSELRDLIFHVQEHRFSIPKISHYLDKLGLTFCGFESEKINKMFKEKYPEDEKLYDLYYWHEFETQYPDTFLGMYQFWCQKL